MMYKGSLILQHSELKNEPKQATVSLALEREGNSNMGEKKITRSQTNWGGGGQGGRKKRKKQQPVHKQLVLRDWEGLWLHNNRISCIIAAA